MVFNGAFSADGPLQSSAILTWVGFSQYLASFRFHGDPHSPNARLSGVLDDRI